MPIMNGIKATEIIRQKLKYFPIMALSGAHQYRDECLESGMDDFLEKPYSSKQLFAKLDELTVKSIKNDFIDNNLGIANLV